MYLEPCKVVFNAGGDQVHVDCTQCDWTERVDDQEFDAVAKLVVRHKVVGRVGREVIKRAREANLERAKEMWGA